MVMITLHHLERSRSHRILWLLEELKVPYEFKEYKRNPVTFLAPKELKQIHPLGKSPVITDGDKTIAESSVILEYLLDHYDSDHKLRPTKTSKDYYDYLYFIHAAEGSFMTYLFLSFVISRFSKPPVPFFVRPVAKILEKGAQAAIIKPNLDSQFKYIDSVLAKNAWFAGESFSAADIQMSYPMLAAGSRSDLSKYPHIKRYLKNISERQAYQKAIEVGGPVMI